MVIALLGTLVVVFLLTKPTLTFFLWLLLSPFFQGKVIDLGTNIPDLSFDRVLIFTLFLGVLLSVLSLRKINTQVDIEDACIIIFLIGCIISITIWKPIDIPQQILLIINQFLSGFVLYFFIKKSNFIKHKKELFFIVCVSILFVFSIPSIAEELTGKNIFGSLAEVAGGAIRVRTFFRTAWEFGIYSVMFLPFTFKFFLFSENKFQKYFSFFTFTIGIVGIIFCFMRGAWLALFIMLLMLYIFEKRSRKVLNIFGVILIGLVVINLDHLVSSEIFLNRISNIDNLLGRGYLIEQQIELIKLHPLFGNGLSPVLNTYYFSTAYNYNSSFTYSTISHNSLMSMLVDLGLISIFYYLPILIILIKALIKIITLKMEVDRKMLFLSLFCSALAFLIQSLTFEARLFEGAGIFFWVILGFISIL